MNHSFGFSFWHMSFLDNKSVLLVDKSDNEMKLETPRWEFRDTSKIERIVKKKTDRCTQRHRKTKDFVKNNKFYGFRLITPVVLINFNYVLEWKFYGREGAKFSSQRRGAYQFKYSWLWGADLVVYAVIYSWLYALLACMKI